MRLFFVKDATPGGNFMSEHHAHTSTWKSRINALGPGIMMASAAVGGSHLIASTQAGALYGWQLALIIILTNLFKYPFFRFSAHYTLDMGKSLLRAMPRKAAFICGCS